MGSSPVRVTSKSLNRTLFGLGILLFGDPYGNGDEHVGSRVQLAIWRSQGAIATTLSEVSLFRISKIPVRVTQKIGYIKKFFPNTTSMFGIPKIYWLFINSFTSFWFLFIISKILGKKQIAQLEFIDYAVGISLGSIAAEWAFSDDRPFYYYAVAMAMFFVLAFLVAIIGRKSSFFKRLFKGKPVTLIYEGQILSDSLDKSKIDVNDLLSMLREKGYFNPNDVAYAIFETSGQLSVLPKGSQKPVVIEDIDKRKIKKSSLTDVLVVDGMISRSGLNEIGKTTSWLLKKLQIKEERELKNIILATYDENDQLNVHYKNQAE